MIDWYVLTDETGRPECTDDGAYLLFPGRESAEYWRSDKIARSMDRPVERGLLSTEWYENLAVTPLAEVREECVA